VASCGQTNMVVAGDVECPNWDCHTATTQPPRSHRQFASGPVATSEPPRSLLQNIIYSWKDAPIFLILFEPSAVRRYLNLDSQITKLICRVESFAPPIMTLFPPFNYRSKARIFLVFIIFFLYFSHDNLRYVFSKTR
jgi:hypothetical protein